MSDHSFDEDEFEGAPDILLPHEHQVSEELILRFLSGDPEDCVSQAETDALRANRKKLMKELHYPNTNTVITIFREFLSFFQFFNHPLSENDLDENGKDINIHRIMITNDINEELLDKTVEILYYHELFQRMFSKVTTTDLKWTLKSVLFPSKKQLDSAIKNVFSVGCFWEDYFKPVFDADDAVVEMQTRNEEQQQRIDQLKIEEKEKEQVFNEFLKEEQEKNVQRLELKEKLDEMNRLIEREKEKKSSLDRTLKDCSEETHMNESQIQTYEERIKEYRMEEDIDIDRLLKRIPELEDENSQYETNLRNLKAKNAELEEQLARFDVLTSFFQDATDKLKKLKEKKKEMVLQQRDLDLIIKKDSIAHETIQELDSKLNLLRNRHDKVRSDLQDTSRSVEVETGYNLDMKGQLKQIELEASQSFDNINSEALSYDQEIRQLETVSAQVNSTFNTMRKAVSSIATTQRDVLGKMYNEREKNVRRTSELILDLQLK
ncbi:hypothetical protein PCE1_001865 [Barthelona sp. PCE]